MSSILVSSVLDWRENLRRARAHYSKALPAILREKSNVWAIDPYAWEVAGIRLSPIESALWHDIRHTASVLYPQLPVGRFFVDFGNPVAQVAIECDGAPFHGPEQAARDQARHDELVGMGWTVYRISGRDCKDTDKQDPETWKFSNNAGFEFVKGIARAHRISMVYQ
jgi:very-short-patch-repair endonuclease